MGLHFDRHGNILHKTNIYAVQVIAGGRFNSDALKCIEPRYYELSENTAIYFLISMIEHIFLLTFLPTSCA